MRAAPFTPLADLTEAQLTTQVVDLARTLGWNMRYHTHRSKHSASGWPDWALVRERLVLLELKREGAKPTDEQKSWLAALLDAGVEAYLIRPRDLTALADVLACRGNPFDGGLTITPLGGAAYRAAERLREATRAEAAA